MVSVRNVASWFSSSLLTRCRAWQIRLRGTLHLSTPCYGDLECQPQAGSALLLYELRLHLTVEVDLFATCKQTQTQHIKYDCPSLMNSAGGGWDPSCTLSENSSLLILDALWYSSYSGESSKSISGGPALNEQPLLWLFCPSMGRQALKPELLISECCLA